jgi:hypothetical protein
MRTASNARDKVQTALADVPDVLIIMHDPIRQLILY